MKQDILKANIGRSLIKCTKVLIAILLMVIILISIYFLLTSPVAFQKSVSIKFVNKSQLILPQANNYIDIKGILEQIPYKGGMVYEVQPKQKYIKTIKDGYGNCSNLAFGLAYYLQQQKNVYQIVHLLPPDSFLKGGGHTLVNTPYIIKDKKNYGLVDVLNGGLPQYNNSFLDINTLRKVGLGNASILSLNFRKNNKTEYYGRSLNKLKIGIMMGDEVNAYFNFIEKVYVPFGNKKGEKLFYDSLSIVFGYYPNIYVLKHDYNALFKGNSTLRILAGVLLFSVRAFLILLAFTILLSFVVWLKKHISRSSV